MTGAFSTQSQNPQVRKKYRTTVKCPISIASLFTTGSILLLLYSSSAFAQDVLVGVTAKYGPLGGGTAFTVKTNGDSFRVVRQFRSTGSLPEGSLVRGKDGYFYGTTTYDGANNCGTIFKMSSSGKMIFTKHLDNRVMGGNPQGSLIQANDGHFYGLLNGGPTGNGTIIKMSSTGVITVLANLDYSTSGCCPTGSLVQGSDGNFYGMSVFGGANNEGTIFKVTPGGQVTVLVAFDPKVTGRNAGESLVEGENGTFYGMTSGGGMLGAGTIFKVTSSGSFTVLKHLDNKTTGGGPQGSLVKGADGKFYGLCTSGGIGYGGIFSITSDGVFTSLRTFYSNEGINPRGSLAVGSDGNFYGMTYEGGVYNNGTIFKCTLGGELSVLRHLDIADGIHPVGSLCKGSDGHLYGMIREKGDNNSSQGTVFKISSSGVFSVLYRFTDGGYGDQPSESLIQAANGYYYGMTYKGGPNRNGGVFRLCSNGSFSALASFADIGGLAEGSLIQAKDGYFYGMTSRGGTNSLGVIFKMSSGGTITVLKNFDVNTGGYSKGSLVQGTDGMLYGMTWRWDSAGNGTVFKISTSGVLTVLKRFDLAITGGLPAGSLVQGADGSFYGMTSQGGANGLGTFFKINSLGAFTVLKHFDTTTGGSPQGNLFRAADGNFYGTTSTGGIYGGGTIFKVTPKGTLAVLKHLNTESGHTSLGSLLQDGNGILYGMTSSGGSFDGGTIFKITTTGTYTVLKHFDPSKDGAAPAGSLVLQQANPVAKSQSVSTAKNTRKKIVLTATGGRPRTYSLAKAPINGMATITRDTLFYTPNPEYIGDDSLYFTARWGCQNSVPAKINIAVSSSTSGDIEGSETGLQVLEEDIAGKPLHVGIMPNPSAGHFSIIITSNNYQPVILRTIDALGRIVEIVNSPSIGKQIHLGQNYKPGLYILEVIQGRQRIVQKLIKTAQ